MSPFWGSPTASVDWCEANYRFSPYVCELFNTVSSLAMVLGGIVGWTLHRRALEGRFRIAFALLALVGFGSAAFHATLRFGLQMLDELPMVYLALVLVLILVYARPSRPVGAWLPAGLAIYAAGITILMSTTRGSVEFWTFNVSFSAIEAFCVVRLVSLGRRSRSNVVQQLLRVGLGLYFAGIACWFVDLRFCGFVARTLPGLGLFNPQLHAVWHLLSTAGLYCVLVAVGYARLAARGASPRLLRRCGLVPYVTVGEAPGAVT
jgi:dihydroceramidase